MRAVPLLVARGSRVRTPTGARLIEELEVGHELVVADPATGLTAVSRLEAVIKSTRECGTLRFSGRALSVTSDHPLSDPQARGFFPPATGCSAFALTCSRSPTREPPRFASRTSRPSRASTTCSISPSPTSGTRSSPRACWCTTNSHRRARHPRATPCRCTRSAAPGAPALMVAAVSGSATSTARRRSPVSAAGVLVMVEPPTAAPDVKKGRSRRSSMKGTWVSSPRSSMRWLAKNRR